MSLHYINGKFTCQHTTGVQRTASGLLTALDDELASGRRDPAHRWILLCPPEGRPPALKCIEVRVIGRPGMSRMLWEQWVLPRASSDGVLMNLAGSAPAFHKRQVCMLHDAAVFDRPEAYTFLFRTWYRLLFSRLARRARVLLTVSEYSRDRLAQHLRMSIDRLHVVPNGADHLGAVEPDTSVFARFGIVPGGYVLAVGSSNPNKNLPALEQAMRRVHAGTGLRLVLVGGVNTHVFARSAADTLGDAVVVNRTGPVSDAELKALYEHAVALAFPSLYEGFGLPPLEAMACGCPVLAARAAAIPEVCGDGVSYFDPSDGADIERSLREMVEEPGRRDALRAAGFAHVGRYRWDHSARQLLVHADTARNAGPRRHHRPLPKRPITASAPATPTAEHPPEVGA
jgi:glycosyltransferase involved in cell wall biosynthesis